MFYRRQRRWAKGTYMRLTSIERLKTFVVTKEDIEAYRTKGKPIDPRKIPQRELSRRIGANESLIGHLTSGRNRTCTPQTAERIAEVLGVDVSVLFDPEEPTTSANHSHQRSVRGNVVAA